MLTAIVRIRMGMKNPAQSKILPRFHGWKLNKLFLNFERILLVGINNIADMDFNNVKNEFAN